METNLKFDISNDLFHAILGLMELAPVPHKHSNPVIQAFIGSQSKALAEDDPADRNRELRKEVDAMQIAPKRRGRPPKAKLNGSTKHEQQAA